MMSRTAFAFFAVLVVMIVCMSSIWLVPTGQGSFSASHGPISALRARQAALRLMNWISAIVSTVAGSAPIYIARFCRRGRAESKLQEIPYSLSLVCTLQC
jgi:hypothetical protein